MKKSVLAVAVILILALVLSSCEMTQKHEHDYDEGAVTTEPTCTKKGVKTYTCRKCGETRTEDIPIDVSGHIAGEKEVIREATCSSSGLVYYTCTECGIQMKEYTDIDENNHKWEEVSHDSTLLSPSMKENVCSLCSLRSGDRKYSTEKDYKSITGYWDPQNAVFVKPYREAVYYLSFDNDTQSGTVDEFILNNGETESAETRLISYTWKTDNETGIRTAITFTYTEKGESITEEYSVMENWDSEDDTKNSFTIIRTSNPEHDVTYKRKAGAMHVHTAENYTKTDDMDYHTIKPTCSEDVHRPSKELKEYHSYSAGSETCSKCGFERRYLVYLVNADTLKVEKKYVTRNGGFDMTSFTPEGETDPLVYENTEWKFYPGTAESLVKDKVYHPDMNGIILTYRPILH